jgi:hypothetical protein
VPGITQLGGAASHFSWKPRGGACVSQNQTSLQDFIAAMPPGFLSYLQVPAGHDGRRDQVPAGAPPILLNSDRPWTPERRPVTQGAHGRSVRMRSHILLIGSPIFFSSSKPRFLGHELAAGSGPMEERGRRPSTTAARPWSPPARPASCAVALPSTRCRRRQDWRRSRRHAWEECGEAGSRRV